MGQTVKVQRQMLEQDIKIFQAKADLQKKLMQTYGDRAIAERRLVSEFLFVSGEISESPSFRSATLRDRLLSVLNEWCQKQQAETAAQIDIYRVQLAEFESQIRIREAMLAQDDRLIVDPKMAM